jgi:alkanesulfonate monooxygenase
MQLGVGLPSFSSESHALPPHRFEGYVQLAEEFGFAGAWLIEHLTESPTYASSLLDPLSTLSYAAGATDSLPIGTSVLLLPLRDPVLVAKRAATIQHLAGRRLTLGLGTGYVEAEFDAVGVPMEERSARYLEGIELLHRLFHEEVVTFDGEFYSVEEFRLEPSLGRPPRILAGGGGHDTDEGRRIYRSVKSRLDYADGWIAAPGPMDAVRGDWASFADYLEPQDRDPEAVERVALQYLHLVPGEDEAAVARQQRNAYRGMVGPARSAEYAMGNWLSGTVEEVSEHLAAYEREGFDEVILYPVTSDPAAAERQLRRYRDLLLPAFG